MKWNRREWIFSRNRTDRFQQFRKIAIAKCRHIGERGARCRTRAKRNECRRPHTTCCQPPDVTSTIHDCAPIRN